jgi:hypothetical protein
MDPWSKGVLVVMAIVAVCTILSVLIERDQRREEAERADPDSLAVRDHGTRLPVDGAVSKSGAQVSAVRQRDTGLVMRDQIERRRRMDGKNIRAFTRAERPDATRPTGYRSDRRESHS